MIIVCSKEGYLCNRLFHFAHLVSFAIENNEIIWYPYIKEYQHLFDNLNKINLKNNKILIYSSPFIHLILRVLRWILIRVNIKCLIIHNESEQVVCLRNHKNMNKRLLFLSGWLIRDKISLSIQKEKIKILFQFKKEIVRCCQERIREIKNNNTLLIGLHIRRGDYYRFEKGKYFYSIGVYKEKMDQLRTIFNKKKVHFLICSNDNDVFNSDLMNGYDISHSRGSEMHDLYSLSICDLIVGPPSTFSGWASFYGSVPLLYLTDQNQIINELEFKIIEG